MNTHRHVSDHNLRITGPGQIVIDNSGSLIGKVRRTFIDDVSSRPSWITVRTGWFHGSESFVPLSAATLVGSRVLIPYSMRTVRDAPSCKGRRVVPAEVATRLAQYYSLEKTASAPAGQISSDRIHHEDALEVDSVQFRLTLLRSAA